jgi:hypothetical protein
MDRKGFSYFRIVLSMWLLGVCSVANAQELVPNGSFDYPESCSPQSLSSPQELVPWIQHYSSPDNYHPCFPSDWSTPSSFGGGGEPLIGEGYIGLIAFFETNLLREFMNVELIEAMAEGTSYHVEFNVSIMDSCWFASRNIGTYFSQNLPPADLQGLLALEPQVRYEGAEFLTDKQGWMKVEGSFTAQGGERYLTIGNFDTDVETDTLFVEGGGAFRPNQPDYWSFAYYYIDGVSVIPDSIYLGTGDIEQEEGFSLYPNPATETVSIEIESKQLGQLQLFDATGRLVFGKRLISNREEIGVGHLPRGVYVAVLVKEGIITARRKVLLQ